MVAHEKQSATESSATRVLRPATKQDLPRIQEWVMEAVETSPFYGAEFKSYESARLSLQYLHRLYEADPAHIMVIQKDAATPAGFMISSPELGSLWLQWSYVLPKYRRGTLAMASLREFVSHWNNGRFHKVATYTKPDNKVARALMTRYKFDHICTLENHIFGEDYLLFEHKLTKITDDYDRGISYLGMMGKLKQRCLAFIGRGA